MNSRRWMMIVAALALMAPNVRADLADLKRTFNELLPGMGQEQAQQKWQEICWNAGAPGHEAERSRACRLMAEKLGPGTPEPARVWLLKQLERIGRGECVEQVTAVVCDNDRLVRDAAIRALANNPDPAAGDKLRHAFKSADDDGLRVALANALGFRGEPASVEVLTRGGLGDVKDPAVVAAVARALGKIATPAAIAALESALEQTRGPVRLQVGDALAKCCQRLFAEGRTDKARAIAKLLYQPDQPARLAGLEGLLSTAGEDVAATILQVLARGDALESSVAAGFVASVASKGIKQLADGLTTLPSIGQVALLQALGARRDRAALPAVATAASSDNQSVKTAALAALGGVGDCSTVPLLVQAIQHGGDAAGTARHSLETVFADGVDQALIDTMKKTEDRGRRALFIEILDHRRVPSAVPEPPPGGRQRRWQCPTAGHLGPGQRGRAGGCRGPDPRIAQGPGRRRACRGRALRRRRVRPHRRRRPAGRSGSGRAPQGCPGRTARAAAGPGADRRYESPRLDSRSRGRR